MEFNYDADILSMSRIERISEACRQTRQRREEIRVLTEQNRDETRPVMIEENRARIDRLNGEIEEFDQMTIDSTRQYAEWLDDIIRRNFLPGGNEEIRNRAIEVRHQLNSVLRENFDIFHGEIRIIEYGMSNEKTNTQETGAPEGPDNIEADIEKFRNDCEILTGHLNDVQARLILGDNVELTNEVAGLDTELSELSNEAEELKNEIDAFRESFGSADFSMTVPEIDKQIKDFKARVKTIKRLQIDKYNARVEVTNNRIVDLKNMSDLDPEVVAMISELSELEPIKNNVSWNSRTYKNIDYNKLVEINQKINAIQARLNVKDDKQPVNIDPVENTYDEEISYIENEIKRIANGIPFATPDSVLNDDIDAVAMNINHLMARLANDKLTLPEDEYNNYFDRLDDCKADLANLYADLRKAPKGNNVYKSLMDMIRDTDNQVFDLSNLIDALQGKVTTDALVVFEERLSEFAQHLQFIESEVERYHNDDSLNETQYQNLNQAIAESRDRINDTRTKLRNPDMAKDVDVFGFLNGQIDGVEKAITMLEEQINKLDKPIKDKGIRKKIDLVVDRIEKEIKAIETNLKLHIEDNPEKYNETKARLDAQKTRLDELNKKYRKKCPFLVKTVKSAKDFYKHHKKAVLIALGLAAIALIHATLGPVIIPAIMHGNLMMMHCAPALRGAFMGINNVLGKAINAKVIGNIWTMANGIKIAPACASASLLKGIAISGMGTAALVTPIVIAIKELIKKMNEHELKEKITQKLNPIIDKHNKHKKTDKTGETVVTEKAVETGNTVGTEEPEKTEALTVYKENEKEIKDNKNKKLRSRAELKKLLEEYKKMKISLEEFCEQNGLSEAEKAALEHFDKKAGGR